jgi:antitoxin CptB
MAQQPPWHQGNGHIDGGLCQSRLPTMTESELSAFEVIIELPDQELLSWVTGEAPVPATLTNALLPEFLKFRP